MAAKVVTSITVSVPISVPIVILVSEQLSCTLLFIESDLAENAVFKRYDIGPDNPLGYGLAVPNIELAAILHPVIQGGSVIARCWQL